MAPMDTRFPGALERSLTRCLTERTSCVSSADLDFVREAIISQSSALRENEGKMTKSLNCETMRISGV